jgi:hypothetical protein
VQPAFLLEIARIEQRHDRGCAQEREVGRQHADNHVRLPKLRQRAPGHLRITAEVRRPQRMADHHNAARRSHVRCLERAPSRRAHADHVEEVGGYRKRGDEAGLAVSADHHLLLSEGRHPFEAGGAPLPVQEGGSRDHVSCLPHGVIRAPHEGEPLPVREPRPAQHPGVRRRKHRDDGRDRQAQHQRRRRQGAPPRESAHGVPHVVDRAPGPRPGVTDFAAPRHGLDAIEPLRQSGPVRHVGLGLGPCGLVRAA